MNYNEHTEKNSKIYNSLSLDDKKIIQMYLTARQFKNAILQDEMFIIPSDINKLKDNTKIDFGGLLQVTARGDKTVTKIFPYIVNKAFACEVYLKLILKEEKFDMTTLRNREKHNLHKLYNNTSEYFKKMILDVFIKNYGKKVNTIFIEKEILKISEVFVQWRYIYEKMDEDMVVNYKFLDTFCNYLDAYAKSIIICKYNYNVDLDIR